MASERDRKIEELEKRINRLNSDKEELRKKIQKQQDYIQDIFKYSDTAVVECTDDFRIINSNGSIEYIFKDAMKSFEQGQNLMMMVYKATHNIKEKLEDATGTDEQEDLEVTVTKFMMGNKDEQEFKIVGRFDDGEPFLLNWTMKRNNRTFINYFKIIPTNSIVKSMEGVLKEEENFLQNKMNFILDKSSEGVIIMDRETKILYANEASIYHYISSEIKSVKSTNFVNRFFYKIFSKEDANAAREIQNINVKVLKTGVEDTFHRYLNERKVQYKVNVIRKGDFAEGLVITSHFVYEDVDEDIEDKKNLLLKIKELSEKHSEYNAQIQEYETNHNWFMKKRREDTQKIKDLQKALNSIYSYINDLPYPVSIQDFPDLTFKFVNRAFEVMLNQPKKEILNKKDCDIFEGESCVVLQDALKKSINSDVAIEYEIENSKIKQVISLDPINNKKSLIRVFLAVV